MVINSRQVRQIVAFGLVYYLGVYLRFSSAWKNGQLNLKAICGAMLLLSFKFYF